MPKCEDEKAMRDQHSNLLSCSQLSSWLYVWMNGNQFLQITVPTILSSLFQ